MINFKCLAVLFSFAFSAFSTKSQSIHPIHSILFENELTWDRVKIEAIRTRKFIFLDCYATWCGPCKYMEKEVYTNHKVAKLFAERFISYKIQMDTSRLDDDLIKSKYHEAKKKQSEFYVNSYPTLLFFTPDGNLVHKGIGSKNVDEFIELALNALDSNRQYYSLVDSYFKGKRNYPLLPYLTQTARSLGDLQSSELFARDYIDNYLFTLPDEKFYTAENIEFIGSNLSCSRERGFSLFYNKSSRVDTLIKWVDNYSQMVVDQIITKEEIAPLIKKEKEPEWRHIQNRVTKLYDQEFAARNVLKARVAWYRTNSIWTMYTKYLVKLISKYGVGKGHDLVVFYLNNYAWEVFQHSEKKYELKSALEWTNEAIKITRSRNPSVLDTKANILYKLGYKKLAIRVQEEVVRLDPTKESFKVTLEKMRSNSLMN